MKAREIRRKFLEFFEGRGHAIVPSAPVVPYDDPTLLFVNAGMNQFKDVFLGGGTRPYSRAVNLQKCIRAGGKHNDLEDVGADTYHHTFFEMMGSWSFGDYFKREAISWAWQLLTEVYGIPKDRMHATYFAGDPSEGLEPDEEARRLWCDLTDIDPHNIHPGNKKDNFWEMGESGPCGPCSEIHVDLTPDKSGHALVNGGSPLVIEIWNLVFIQFNRNREGQLSPLPAKHIDTGMGFERLVMVLQGKFSNYETDLLLPIITHLEQATGAGPYGGTLPSAQPTKEELRDVAYRVLTDHLRCLTVAISDGAMPSNEGRGYVLRRILRRAYTYARRHLGVTEPFLYKQVPFIVERMQDDYPDMAANGPRVADVVREEEEAFHATLDHGLKLFTAAADSARSEQKSRLSGDDAFKLHDTYGFPIDLTRLMAREQGLAVDEDGFARLMEESRARARSGGRADALGPVAALFAAAEANLVSDPARPAPTRDELKWETIESQSQVLGWVNADGRFQSSPIESGTLGGLVTEQTCFYGEQGGQVGDCGAITTPTGAFRVTDTRKVAGVTLHIGQVESGRIESGQTATLSVDADRRGRISRNHTATHVMNWSLREVLGDHVHQKGSVVDADKTRFDFSHTGPLGPAEVERIEGSVNDAIGKDLAVHIEEVGRDAALSIEGIRAVFDDQYADVVRLVVVGPPIADMLADPSRPEWRKFSVELCGGTHLSSLKSTGRFALVSDEGVGRGVRRIVGLTGEAAAEAESIARTLLADADALAKQPAEEWSAGVEELTKQVHQARIPIRDRAALVERIRQFRETIAANEKQQSKDAGAAILERAATMLDESFEAGGVPCIVGELPGAQAEHLRTTVDWFRRKLGNCAVALFSTEGGKVTILAGVTPDLVKRGVKANELVSQLSRQLGGGGGGRPDLAQGGGVKVDEIPAAVESARAWLTQKLGG